MEYAPLAVFACKRPEHLRNLLASLKSNEEAASSDLTIFIGGPKNSDDWPKVHETVTIAEAIAGFKSVKVRKAFEITGASDLIKFGIDSVLTEFNSVIVLEDDLLVRRDFLLYMNTSLIQYQDDPRIGQISGWNFGIIKPSSPKETYFMQNNTSWGWATWRRVWNPNPNIIEDFRWLVAKSARIHRFNMNETSDCLGMVEAVLRDGYDAWDVCWYLECFRKNLLVLYPNSSLIINAGFDGTGCNFDFSFDWNKDFVELPQDSFIFPNTVQVSKSKKIFLNHHRNWVRASINKRFLLPHAVARKMRQHIKYYKKGFYISHENPQEYAN